MEVAIMPSLLIAINWIALLEVAAVTIGATVVIATLMSLANWCFTPAAGADNPTVARKTIGFLLIATIGVIVIFGLYLMIPYFH
jgi:hypothetical protein